MEVKKSLLALSPARIICSFYGHRLHISKNITNHIKEYKCARCGEEMTDTAHGFLEKLTPRFRETNEFLAKIHERRNRREIFSEAS